MKRFLFLLLSVILLLLPMTLLPGCNTPSLAPSVTAPHGKTLSTSQGEAPFKRCYLIGLDRSKSTDQLRAKFLSAIYGICTGLDPKSDTMRLYRFGNSVEEIYSGLPSDEDAFALALVKLKESDPVPYTNYPAAVELIAEAAANTPEPEVTVLIVGDGQNDFKDNPQAAKRYRDAVARLAENPKVISVRFWGVTPGAHEEIRKVFQPLGQRLRLLTADQDPLAP